MAEIRTKIIVVLRTACVKCSLRSLTVLYILRGLITCFTDQKLATELTVVSSLLVIECLHDFFKKNVQYYFCSSELNTVLNILHH